MKPKDEKKLNAIFAATCRLTAERGLFGLTLAEIAKAAEIGTSTLYVYFADKEALFNEVFRRAKLEAVTFYGDQIDPTASLKARIRALWNGMLDHRLQRFDQVSFLEQYESSSLMSDESRAYHAQITKRLMQMVAEGQAAELLKPAPAVLLNALFVGSIRETARLIRGRRISDTEEARTIAFQLCWDAVRA